MFESGIETMWKTLHQLAIPPRLYQICGWFIPWLAIASVVVLTVGWIWGFGFAPADYQQGNSYRIIYLHVPAAIWSMGIYASMAVAAFIGLVWQMKMANWRWRRWPHWCRVYLYCHGYRLCMGKTDVGHGGYGMHV